MFKCEKVLQFGVNVAFINIDLEILTHWDTDRMCP